MLHGQSESGRMPIDGNFGRVNDHHRTRPSARTPALPRALLVRRRHRLFKACLTERVGAVRAARAPLARAVRPQVAAAALPRRRLRTAVAAAPD